MGIVKKYIKTKLLDLILRCLLIASRKIGYLINLVVDSKIKVKTRPINGAIIKRRYSRQK